ncbi:hypothetical protein [Empedobacter brevis]|uniref:hypothetical protein n=1 Tax=Empedobacter brevis TaxID=247 RepID=UPI0039B0A814
MGFGFNLFFVFILIPLTVIFLSIWLITKKKFIGKTLGIIWIGIFCLVMVASLIQWLTSKTKLNKKDFYGEYIINRNYFPGKQADWQYENFRFEIKNNDSIYFYITDKENVIKTYKGVISTIKPYNSERLRIHMQQPTHHILSQNPTIYRSSWSFYLVFNSQKLSNVYFKKGKWKSINTDK